jgi:hypothetical protein
MAVREFVAFCQRYPHLRPQQRPVHDAESVDDEMEEDRAWEEAEADEHTWDDDDAWAAVVDMDTDDFLLLRTVDEKVVVDTCGDSGVVGNVMIVWVAVVVVEVVLEICVVNVPVFALPVVRSSSMMILDCHDSEDSKYCGVWKFVQYIC